MVVYVKVGQSSGKQEGGRGVREWHCSSGLKLGVLGIARRGHSHARYGKIWMGQGNLGQGKVG